MAIQLKELDFKLKEYPNVRYNMAQHSVFNTFLKKATTEQLQFCEDFFNEDVEILFNEAPAGTGKTMCSVACAYAEHLNTETETSKGKKLVFIIAPVAEDLGSRPGSQGEKEMAYFLGLHDALKELEMVPEQEISEMLLMQQSYSPSQVSECWVSQVSHLFLRGSNLKNVTVIINEAQNFKRSELKKVLTRLHADSKCIVEGNYKQIDLKSEAKSGLEPYWNYFKNYDGAVFHHFTVNFRSKLAQYADDFNWKN